MNRPELWLALVASAPLFSYFAGKFNRWAGLAAGGLAAGASAAMLARAGGVEAGPAALLFAWTAGALFHSFKLNSGQVSHESPSLRKALDEAAALEKELARAKDDAKTATAGEKKSQAVYAAVKLLSEALDLSEAAGRLGRHLKDYFGTDQAALYLADKGRMELFAQAGGYASLPGLEQVPGLFGGWPEVPAFKDGLAAAPVSGASVDQELVGFLLFKPADPATALDDAGRFSSEMAFALRRVQLFRQVERLSLTDGLTGLWRRGALDEKIAEEFRRASALKTQLGFMIIDIDHFKRLNDTYGHQFGDMVLRRVAQLLKEGVYETDFVGRYGGEEFGIVLPRADAAGVLRKAETIRARIENESFSQGLDRVRLTASIGIASFPRDAESPSDLVASADKALYAAKEGGRNRVVDAASQRR